MDITLLYFEACPNWKILDDRVQAIAAERGDLRVTWHLVETQTEADRVQFHGSPSILVDGVDLFSEPGDPVGLSCRRYATAAGYQGAPTLEQLRTALEQA